MGTATLVDVRDLIARVLEVDRRHVAPETRLMQDLGADSIDRLEVATELEEAFGVSLSDDQIQRMNTVHDAAEMVIVARHSLPSMRASRSALRAE